MINKNIQKGFTLIELLVVIAIIGILAAAVLSLIDPIDKFNAANDAKVQSDINQLVTAAQTYYTDNGKWPANITAMVPSEIQSEPLPPASYQPHYTFNGVGVGGTGNFGIYSIIKSKKNTAGGKTVYQWCSATNQPTTLANPAC